MKISKRSKISFFVIVACLVAAIVYVAFQKNDERWVVYYTNNMSQERFEDFDLIVFDSDSHPKLDKLKKAHKTVLGYISLGEAEAYRKHYDMLEEGGMVVSEDIFHNGHKIIDIRNPEWKECVMNDIIPSILKQGFDGIMIDTIDSVAEAEQMDSKKYKGMRQSAIKLIKDIRKRYPNIKIMVNRGFRILPSIAKDIDMVLAESIYTDWQPTANVKRILPISEYQNYVKQLKDAQAKSPSLKVYTLDYWLPSDKEGIQHIYEAQRKSGFIPYVSTQDLQAVYY